MKEVLAVLMLLIFAGIGVAHVFKPDLFVKRSGVRKGGDLLSEYNRMGFQLAGAIFAAGAIWVLYSLLRQ
jgi:hypothetical protein